MKKSRFSTEQIIGFIKQADAGTMPLGVFTHGGLRAMRSAGRRRL